MATCEQLLTTQADVLKAVLTQRPPTTLGSKLLSSQAPVVGTSPTVLGLPLSAVNLQTCTITDCGWLTGQVSSQTDCASTIDRVLNMGDPTAVARELCTTGDDNPDDYVTACIKTTYDNLMSFKDSALACCEQQNTGFNIAKYVVLFISVLVVCAVIIWKTGKRVFELKSKRKFELNIKVRKGKKD